MNKVFVLGLILCLIVLSPSVKAMEQKKDMSTAPAAVQAEAAQPVEVGNKICPVSGEKIKEGDMGGSVKIEHNGKMYTLCCGMCIKDFKKDPEKYSAIADKEVSKDKEASKTE